MKTITIRETDSMRRQWIHRAKTDDEHVAIKRTLRRYWGGRAMFCPHRELDKTGMTGEIITMARGGGLACVPDNVHITIN